ncbi:MAG: protein-disulfide reductase DsbD domain-containing protein [Acidobacteriota bacterium]
MAPTLSVAPLPTVKAKKGSEVVVTLKASLPAGYHANSNKPTEAYLIPLTLKWTGGPLQMDAITYPKAEMEKYSFSDKPISVVTGEFSIATKFKVPAEAANGPAAQTGTLRYQACDNKACYPPKTLPINVTVSVE